MWTIYNTSYEMLPTHTTTTLFDVERIIMQLSIRYIMFIVTWTCPDAWAPYGTWDCSSSWPCKDRTDKRRRALCYTRTCDAAADFSCTCTLCGKHHMGNFRSLQRQTLKPVQLFL